MFCSVLLLLVTPRCCCCCCCCCCSLGPDQSKTVRIAVASGIMNARQLVEDIRAGRAQYDFVEVMMGPLIGVCQSHTGKCSGFRGVHSQL
jgi:hypothetical protein